ncbi:MAG: hypothetical protein QM775_08235 [Pirellulales bacterium]
MNTTELPVFSGAESMAKDSEEKKVRLQVPVSLELEEEIRQLAEPLHMSLRKMAGALLDETAKGRKATIDNIISDITVALTEASRMVTGKTRHRGAPKSEPIHLDVLVEPETADFIAILGEKLGHPPGRMAGQVLRWGVLENSWVIRYMAAPMVKVVEKYLAVKKAIQARKKKANEA